MVCLVEDTTYALHLLAHMLAEGTPDRLMTNGAIAGERATTLVTQEFYLSVFLQGQGHRAVLSADDVYAVGLLTTVVGIVGEDEAAHRQFRALEVLHPEEGIAGQLKEAQAEA